MGNKLFVSMVCCTLEMTSWNSQDYFWGTVGVFATLVSVVALVLDSPWMQGLANRCSGFDLPESRRLPPGK